jgi:hypothetical protein
MATPPPLILLPRSPYFCVLLTIYLLQHHIAPAILSPIVQKSTNGFPVAAEPSLTGSVQRSDEGPISPQ